MRVLNAHQRPRALLLNWPQEQESALMACFPTARVITHPSEVEPSEWDLLVACRGLWLESSPPLPDLYLLSFGEGRLGRSTAEHILAPMTEVWLTSSTPATEFTRPHDLERDIAREAESLVTAALDRGWNPYIANVLTIGSPPRVSDPRPEEVTPFLATNDGLALAGAFTRKGSLNAPPDPPPQCWALPEFADPVRWARLAITQWSRTDPARFPAEPDWRYRHEWASPDELAAYAELDRLEAEFAKAARKYDQGANLARQSLRAARDRADGRERLLLTSQGDTLVSAVEECLCDLGYQVRNMDRELPQHDRREDLRVTDPGTGSVAIAEIRGYKDGARVNDLIRISGRFAQRFLQDEGKQADRQWYIVNQFIERPPTEREAPLAAAGGELATFAELGGLVIDTRDLLQLWLAVERGDMTMDKARQLLSGTGRMGRH